MATKSVKSVYERVKSLEDLNIATKGATKTTSDLLDLIDKGDFPGLEAAVKEIIKFEKHGVNVGKLLDDMKKTISSYNKELEQITNRTQPKYEEGLKRIASLDEQRVKAAEKQKKVQEGINKVLSQTQKAMENIVKSNQQIYETSHKMQLEGNVTWREFTKLYDNAYQSARKLNSEIGKQLFTARELIGVQEKLITQGWKGLDATTLGNVTASVSLLTRTMGNVDDRLVKAFEGSYKQFGDSTGFFVEQLGDRLNNFSNSFGMTVSMLQGTIADMMSANTFLARNNMNAQIRANESLMQATALIAQVGIETTGFMNALSRVSQFGTAEQMGGIFQAGALLQDFSAGDFQSKLRGQDYAGATQDLIGSIYQTLNSMEEGYLRNQYMQMIGSGFGLSQDDLLEIMAHGGKLDEYAIEIQEKLAESSGSMEQELRDLHMDLKQRFENWWENSGFAQGLGKILNEVGLYGFAPFAFTLVMQLNKIIANQGASIIAGGGKATGSGGIINAMGGFRDLKGAPISGGAALGRGLGGLGIATASTAIGRAGQAQDNRALNIGGGMLNVLGSAAGGALAGSMFGVPGAVVGGLIGAGSGIYNTIIGANERRQAQAQAEDERRVARRQQQQQSTSSSQDPTIILLESINRGINNLTETVDSNAVASRTLTTRLEVARITSTEKVK